MVGKTPLDSQKSFHDQQEEFSGRCWNPDLENESGLSEILMSMVYSENIVRIKIVLCPTLQFHFEMRQNGAIKWKL
ncbi:MAG: hypothetical protein CL921_06235 [Deltaproteobacteria bacterium]|nr:hypothetical protein [Deltaproteobacteria bacterium]